MRVCKQKQCACIEQLGFTNTHAHYVRQRLKLLRTIIMCALGIKIKTFACGATQSPPIKNIKILVRLMRSICPNFGNYQISPVFLFKRSGNPTHRPGKPEKPGKVRGFFMVRGNLGKSGELNKFHQKSGDFCRPNKRMDGKIIKLRC